MNGAEKWDPVVVFLDQNNPSNGGISEFSRFKSIIYVSEFRFRLKEQKKKKKKKREKRIVWGYDVL